MGLPVIGTAEIMVNKRAWPGSHRENVSAAALKITRDAE
jgi:hypothetical protein